MSAEMITRTLQPWQLGSDDGNMLDQSIWAIRDREREQTRQLDAARREVAAALNGTIADLRDQLADAHELIAALQEQLEDAQCAALSAQAVP